jgi:hypothetical protein
MTIDFLYREQKLQVLMHRAEYYFLGKVVRPRRKLQTAMPQPHLPTKLTFVFVAQSIQMMQAQSQSVRSRAMICVGLLVLVRYLTLTYIGDS